MGYLDMNPQESDEKETVLTVYVRTEISQMNGQIDEYFINGQNVYSFATLEHLRTELINLIKQSK